MRSFAASAFVPNSFTTRPFTRTCPLKISSSACRREAIPARAIIFCNLSCIVFFLSFPCRGGACPTRLFGMLASLSHSMLYKRATKVLSFRAKRGICFSLLCELCVLCVEPLFPRRCGFLSFTALRLRHPLVIRRRLFQQFLPRFPRQRLELLQARQLLQIAQPKPHQKFLRRLIQDRPPHHFLPPRRRNQVLVQQRADHSRSVHTANLRNFRRRNRLLVRNHRQRLQRRHGQPQRRPQALDKPPHHVMLLRLRIQLVPARHRANLDPSPFRRIARHQFIQRRLHRQLLFPQRLRQLLDRRRLIRRINNRFQRRCSFFVCHRTPEVKEIKDVKEVKEKPNSRASVEPYSRILLPGLLILYVIYFRCLLYLLFVFLINLFDPALLIKHQIKHLVLPHHNLPKLLFLRQRHRLQLHHLQHRQERHDHRVPRRARLKKLNQVHRVVRARQNLRPQRRDHLRHGELFVPQLDPRHFLPPLQHLLEHLYYIDQ